MRLRFIYPRFIKFLEDHPAIREILRPHVVGDYTMPPSLALPILAALTPEDIEVKLTDDNIGQPIDFDEKADAVIISFFTPQANRAYEIADEFRRRGTPVVLGGIHPTCRPQEAALHADAVCVGEGESMWPKIIADLKSKSLRPFYRPSLPYNLADMPIPKRDIFCRDHYRWNAHLIITMRGCPVRCDGCPIPLKEETELRFRPVENIITDIRSMSYRQFYLTDDTLMLPGKRSMKFLLRLMERTGDMDVSIFLASTMMMTPEPAFYRQLKAGRVSSIYTIFGFDRVSRRLFSDDCSADDWRQAIALVHMIEDAGIRFFASFGIGFDYHNTGVVERILRFASEAEIDLAEFYIPTPFPGTPFGELAERQQRIMHRDYSRWNHGNLVFRPMRLTEREIVDGFELLWREFYRTKKPSHTLEPFDVQDPVSCGPAIERSIRKS